MGNISIFDDLTPNEKIFYSYLEREYFSLNVEYMFLYQEWKKFTNDRIFDLINDLLSPKKREFTPEVLNINYDNTFQANSRKRKIAKEILMFHRSLTNVIFSQSKGVNFTNEINVVHFPTIFTSNIVNKYLAIVRQACYRYGLKILLTERRSIMVYWEKVFNTDEPLKNQGVPGTFEEVFGFEDFKASVKDKPVDTDVYCEKVRVQEERINRIMI